MDTLLEVVCLLVDTAVISSESKGAIRLVGACTFSNRIEREARQLVKTAYQAKNIDG